ncbi:hypothetical protein PFLUV_G00190460 [Perca fluviatilis]|uniref:Uncharacterized protein n=1 Tax=Perca fluviatilis TaxID=8168 RepID=A0A6A5EJD1_PERFL|nr:hypothetical protein PFLUV_G00190460 [Perca fluviatilis]
MNKHVQDIYKSSLLYSVQQQPHLKAQDKQLKPVISAGTMAKVADTQNISIDDNAGKVGADNAVDVEGGLGCNANLGNTTDITVIGKNTEKGRIGAENSYKIEGGLKNAKEIGLRLF